MAATVEQALEALSSIGLGNVSVSGSAGGPYTVTFINALGNRSLSNMTASGASLTGGTDPAVAVAQVTDGTPGGATWTKLMVDHEKDTELLIVNKQREIIPVGEYDATDIHSIMRSIFGVKISLLQSGIDAIKLAFPEWPEDSPGVHTIPNRSIQIDPCAIAMEYDLGVWHFTKCVPVDPSSIKQNLELTQFDFVYRFLGDDANTDSAKGYFYEFS